MRILMWTPLYLPRVGGVEHYVQRLAGALDAKGCEIEIVTNSLEGEGHDDVIDGIRVTRLPFPVSRDLSAVRAVRSGLASILARLEPEIVNVHTSGPSLAHLDLHRSALRGNVVLTLHGVFPPSSNTNGHLDRHLGAASAAIASSEATRRSLREATGRDVPIEVVYPSLDHQHRPPVPFGTAPVITAVGRLVPEKGFDVLIQAFAAVHPVVPATRLVIVGDGPERTSLEHLTESLALRDHVEFTGLIDDDGRIAQLDRATVAAVPSVHEEGFGMVAIEASARGRAVVASRCGGLNEAVIDGTTGVLVVPNDAPALAVVLIDLLIDRRRAAQLGKGGLVHAARFDAGELAGVTMSTFERTLDR